MGTFLLKGLFHEENTTDKTQVLYTLKDEDHLGYPSLHRLYMETADPTEYRFALEHLGGLQHWEALQNCSWFKPYIQRWRRELSLKIQSEALAEIIKTGSKPGKDQLSANKFILLGSWNQTKATKGRPSKEDIKRAAFELAEETSKTSEDYARIMEGSTTPRMN
jgi:hypothetical protein